MFADAWKNSRVALPQLLKVSMGEQDLGYVKVTHKLKNRPRDINSVYKELTE